MSCTPSPLASAKTVQPLSGPTYIAIPSYVRRVGGGGGVIGGPEPFSPEPFSPEPLSRIRMVRGPFSAFAWFVGSEGGQG